MELKYDTPEEAKKAMEELCEIDESVDVTIVPGLKCYCISYVCMLCHKSAPSAYSNILAIHFHQVFQCCPLTITYYYSGPVF